MSTSFQVTTDGVGKLALDAALSFAILEAFSNLSRATKAKPDKASSTGKYTFPAKLAGGDNNRVDKVVVEVSMTGQLDQSGLIGGPRPTICGLQQQLSEILTERTPQDGLEQTPVETPEIETTIDNIDLQVSAKAWLDTSETESRLAQRAENPPELL